MSLTTIGFGNVVPGTDPFPDYDSSTTLWFCSIYIMSGMALTAMSFNVVHDEIVHRLVVDLILFTSKGICGTMQVETPGQVGTQTKLGEFFGRIKHQRLVQSDVMTIRAQKCQFLS